MWRPWSRALELLGRIRFPRFPWRRAMGVGDPRAPDARGGHGWRGYLGAERLYDVWGPHPHGPWVPFHCVPLFAALDRLQTGQVGPTRPPEAREDGGGAPGALALPILARPGAPPPRWLTGDTWTILDLPGPAAVEAAAWLVTSADCQPVCTFDNWPHPRGVLRAEQTLAELLRWATTVAEARPRLRPESPPLWVCDSERLGSRRASPGQFDNRYYLDDSILPGPATLRRAGVARVVYVTMGGESVPLLDLEGYFAELLAAGLPLLHAELEHPDLEPRPFAAPKKPRRVNTSSYRRSSAGGFGTEVPEPSSGSSG
jgi:hypothetical protein